MFSLDTADIDEKASTADETAFSTSTATLLGIRRNAPVRAIPKTSSPGNKLPANSSETLTKWRPTKTRSPAFNLSVVGVPETSVICLF